MLPNRYASQLAPLLLRNGTRIALPRATRLPRQIPAIAVLIPHRSVTTETSEQNNNQPPPGFNLEQAKRPLAKDADKSKSADQAATKSNEAKPIDVSIPVNKPSDLAPTAAAEQRALSELAHQAAVEGKKEEAKKEELKKLTIWQKIKHEAQHYWDGTKLLATEVKISSRLALKMAASYELTRREHRQLRRTVQDLGRLVPFSVFVIVPFAELLLPVALKLFPNLLPSTYENAKSKESKAVKLRTSRKEVSKFLRETMRESGLPVSSAATQKEEFTEFFRKVRDTGEEPTKSDVIKVCKLFKDDLTLDNLSRPQLVGICRYNNLTSFGTDAMLRYNIRHRMRQIKRDDRFISHEGVESLSVTELQNACAVRGLRTHGMSPARLRDDLQLWLDLRLKYGVPSILLILSNAFMFSDGKEVEFNSQLSALQAVLSSIPQELLHEIELEVHNAEGATTNKQRLQVLQEQQKLIQSENEQVEQHRASGKGPVEVDDKENIDDKEEVTEQTSDSRQAEAAQEMQESERDLAKQQKTDPATDTTETPAKKGDKP